MAKAKRCPHCGGTNTRLVKAGYGCYLVAEIIGFSISLWLPIIGWMLLPIFVIAMIVTALMMLVGKKDYHFYCDDCKKSFDKMEKDQYEYYKAQGFRM